MVSSILGRSFGRTARVFQCALVWRPEHRLLASYSMTMSQHNLNIRPEHRLKEQAILESDPENAVHTRKIMAAAKGGKSFHWPQVRAAFDAVPKKTQIIYTAAITAAGRCGALHEGVALLTEMRAADVAFSGPTYTSAINLYGRQGHLAEARIMWDQMIAEGIPADASSCTALMNAAATAGDLSATEALLKELPSYGVQAGNPQYGCLLKACRNQRQARRALEVLAEMRQANVPPTIVQYTIAVGACRQAMEQSDPEAANIAHEMQAAMEAEGVSRNEFFLEEMLCLELGTNIKNIRSPADVSTLKVEAVKDAVEKLEAAKSRGVRMTRMLRQLEYFICPRPTPPEPAVLAQVREPAVRWRVELRPTPDGGQPAMVFWSKATGEEVAGTPAEGWAEVPSPEHGRPYFWDMASGITRWDQPTGPAISDASVAATPGRV